MPQDIAEHLVFLYGTTAEGPVESRLRALMRDRFPEARTAVRGERSKRGERGAGEPAESNEAPAGSRRQLPLTQRDALLITYGDQVRQEGVAPLHTLGEFLHEHAAG